MGFPGVRKGRGSRKVKGGVAARYHCGTAKVDAISIYIPAALHSFLPVSPRFFFSIPLHASPLLNYIYLLFLVRTCDLNFCNLQPTFFPSNYS